jgi:hypothetical protein
MIGGVYGRDVVKKPDVLVDASCEPSKGRPESDHFCVVAEDDASDWRRRTSDLQCQQAVACQA